MKPPSEEAMLDRALGLAPVASLLQRLGTDFVPRVLLVGGAVRDLLLGAPVLDIDLSVEGPVEEVTTALGGQVRTHGRFSTATVSVDAGHVDLARTRRETYAHPGALPDVEPASIAEDLARRDFTVNAMAVPLTGTDRGRLLSAPAALSDLEGRRLRVLHDQSFIDDPTRLLRLVRYSARLGFAIESGTLALACRALADGALATVSGPRIGNELRLLAAEADPVTPWQSLHDLGIDVAIESGFGVKDPELAARALGLLPPEGRPEVITLALAVEGLEPPARGGLLDRLGFPARLRDDVLRAAAEAEHVARRLRDARRPSEVAVAVGDSATIELVALAGAIGAEEPARLWLERLRHASLQIDGADMLAAGVPSGPAIGAGLAAARAAVLDGKATSRQEQLEEALRAAQGSR